MTTHVEDRLDFWAGGTTEPPEADAPRLRRAASAGAVVLAGYACISAVLVGAGWLLVHASFLAPLRAFDDSVSRWVTEHRVPWLDGWVLRVGRIADTLPVVGVAVLVCAVLAVRRWWADIAVLAVGLPLELFAFLTANYVIARPRPDVAKLGDQPDTFSYPSGHIAATIVLWGGIALLLIWHFRRRWLGPVAILVVAIVAGLVGFSRVYRGMHHLLDVAAGVVLGVAALAIAIAVRRMIGRSPSLVSEVRV